MTIFESATQSFVVLIALTAITIINTQGRAADGNGPIELYVSPAGNDSWSGRTPDIAEDDGPFATLTRARAELRKLKADGGLSKPATVYLRQGTYSLDDTFQLGPQDAGTEECPIVYRNYRNETVRIIGGRKISGFEKYEGQILRVDLTGTDLEGVVFDQLFFRGQPQTLARYPNIAPDDPDFGEWAHVRAVDGRNVKDRFTYTPDVYKDWTNIEHARVHIHPGYDWAWNIVPIEKVDIQQQKIILGKNVSYHLRVGDRYFVQNLLEELDAPGEWYLDRGNSVLYFWPPADISDLQVIVPVVDDLLEMKGAAHVTFRGLTIEMCDGDAVRITNSQNCRVAGCVIRNCRGWGVRISGGNHSGAIGNDVYETGHGGISVNGGDRRTLQAGNNFATNNYIHHVAQYWRTYRPGVSIRGVGNRADHNWVHDTYHAGITLGGNENVVEFNHVHHTNLGSADTGGIYFCSRDWTERGNVIRYNMWHHIGGFGKANSWRPVSDGKVWFEYPHFTWGIYLDDPTSGTRVYGNILWSVPICGLHNHGGRDNTFRNNIIIDCPAFRAGQLRPNWSCWPAIKEKLKKARYDGSPYLKLYPELENYETDRPQAMTGLKFINNIVYYTEEGSRWLREQHEDSWNGGQQLYSLRVSKQDFHENVWDGNCIYAPDSIDLHIRLQRPPDIDDRLTWQQWQKLGVDENSILADPMFVDLENRNFRLRPGSPALKLGFEQIPVDKIGPFEDELRASWPIERAAGVADRGTFTTRRYFQLPGYEPEPAQEIAIRDGIGNVVEKLKGGEPVKVAYFGGGIHGGGGWRKQVMNWLRQQYPDADISTINAGICDCVRGSDFSVYRLRHDVLEREPDLILVDFTSDDHRTDVLRIWRTIEGVVRQTWQYDAEIDLLFLYAFRSGFESAYSKDQCPSTVTAYEKVAKHYGVPSINMGYRIAKMAKRDELVIEASAKEAKQLEDRGVFSRDGVRPTADGRRIYSEVITRGLKQLAANSKAGEHELEEPFREDNLEEARLAPITRDMLAGDWNLIPPDDIGGRDFSDQFDRVWYTDSPGANLTFTFRGTDASIFNLRGPDTGRVAVTIDGRDAGTRTQVDRWCHYQRLSGLPIASGLVDEEHKVTIELLPEAPDRSEPIAEAKRLDKYEPEEFEGVALRFAWLRIVGEVVN